MDSEVSRTLSYLLRHAAKKEGISIREDGYCKVSELLRHRSLKRYDVDIHFIKKIVEANSKQRFSLRHESGMYWIRANQGHSIDVKVEMTDIKDPDEIPVAIHGTTMAAWKSIENSGLSRMSRQHIHFATGMFGDSGVVSGMRRNCEVFIHLDVSKAMNDGISFYKSSNGVVLTSGKDGILPPIYFERVLNSQGGVIYESKMPTIVVNLEDARKKQIKNLEKKLGQIKDLKEKRDDGAKLELNQIAKISLETKLLEELATLKL